MKNIFPKVLYNSYKGQNGRMCIIGGSLDYTSAPFYSAISQLKGGADLAHIICTKQAAIPIKSYSPEIIVHPYINALNEQESSYHEIQKISDSLNKINDWLSAFTSFVIGPGLGKDIWIQQILSEVFENIVKKQIIVLDADATFYMVEEFKQKGDEKAKIYHNFVNKDPQIHIITPNQKEFDNLWKCFIGKQIKQTDNQERITQMLQYLEKYKKQHILNYVEIADLNHPIVKDTVFLAQKLNHINIIHKGMIDVVTNGKKAFLLLEQSSFKRCGGIGDILCGLTGLYTYLAYRQSQEKNLSLKVEDVILLGCVYSGCITRKASQMAFAKYNFSLTAPNIIEFIGQCHITAQDLYQKQ